jgi:signal transduction histidine kinase
MTFTRLSSRIDLRAALVLYVVVPLSIALGFASYQRLQSLEDWIEKLLQEDVELIARTLQLPLSGALQRYDRQALGEALKTVYQLNREFGIYIYDDTGRALTAVNKIVPEPLSQDVLRSVLSGKRQGAYGDLAGSDVYSYFVPLTEKNTAIGVLQVTRLVSDFHDYFTRVRLQTLLWWMAAVAIMTALVLSGHHLAIGKPLGRLVSSIAAVTAGDRRHRAPTQGPSEEQIVRQLLDFGRNQGDQRRMMAADQLAAMALAAVQERFAESGTALTISGPRSVPTLLVNPMRVEQALVNLLRNACQANPGGNVKLSWFATLDGVSFRVEDGGPGIPDAVRQKIFEPFYSTKAVGQGSGLGLAIVESVAREHGGTIEVCDSSLGGAGFLLRLPQNMQYNDEKTEGSDNDG